MASKKAKPKSAAPEKAATGKSSAGKSQPSKKSRKQPVAAADPAVPVAESLRGDANDEINDIIEEDMDLDVQEIDPEDLDEEAFEAESSEFDDDEAFVDVVAEEDVEEEEIVPAARRATEEEDDEDLTTPDDVEADLDTILKDRLVAADDQPNEDDEEHEVEDRSTDGDALQPRRADEEMCTSCFLLVRRAAPNCPVGDDDCPIFAR